MSTFQVLKNSLVAIFGLSKDSLHVYVGMIVFLVTALLLRKRPRTLAPLLVVVLAACIGELLDARDDFALLHRWRWRASLHDVINTSFWPLVLTVLTRINLMRIGKAAD